MALMLGLTGCSSNEIYDETLSTEEKGSIEDTVSSLVSGFSVRYTFNDEVANQTAELFNDLNKYLSAYENYKARVQEKGLEVDSDKLYIDSYMTDEKKEYEEAREYGLKHGLLYTNGKQTGFEPVMEEIEPLEEGQTLESRTEGETQETQEAQEAQETEPVETVDKYEGEMSDEEYRAYLDELFNQEPEYVEISREMIELDTEGFSDKQQLIDYVSSKMIDSMYFDSGDYEPTEDEIIMSAICYIGYDEEGTGIISEEDWNNFTYEEAREHVIKLLVYAYDSYNKSLRENYEYTNSDEFKNQFITSRQEARREKEDRESREAEEHVINAYDMWRMSEKDNIEFVQVTDFENPVFSEVIQKDEKGYYIPWEKIYALADETGRLTEDLEFLAYGQTVHIKMPEAPLSYYKDKEVKLIRWDLVVNASGSETLEIYVQIPDKTEDYRIDLGITEDGKLLYTTDIATYIFD